MKFKYFRSSWRVICFHSLRSIKCDGMYVCIYIYVCMSSIEYRTRADFTPGIYFILRSNFDVYVCMYVCMYDAGVRSRCGASRLVLHVPILRYK